MFLKNLIGFYVIMEGIFFYVGFVQILSLGRQNKMTGAAEQYQYILRDESLHLNFGIDVINQIKLENPHLWTRDFQEEVRGMLKEAAELQEDLKKHVTATQSGKRTQDRVLRDRQQRCAATIERIERYEALFDTKLTELKEATAQLQNGFLASNIVCI